MNIWADAPWAAIEVIAIVILGTPATLLSLLDLLRRRQRTHDALPVQARAEPVTGKLSCCLGEMRRGGFTDLIITNIGSSPVSQLEVFVNDVDLPEHSGFHVNTPPDREKLRRVLRPGERLAFTFGILEAGDPNIDRIEVSWLDTDRTRRSYQTDLRPCGNT